MKNKLQQSLFEISSKNEFWKKEWKGMPEYNNDNIKAPEITATFKFANKADFDLFHKIIKKELYKGAKVFDGMQTKDKKTAWFPLKEKASKYVYK